MKSGGKGIKCWAVISESGRKMESKEWRMGTSSGEAKLDRKFKSKSQVRYVDPEARIGISDGESAAFVSKAMLDGEPGRLVVTGNQPNEGDSGPAVAWFTDGEFDCE